MNLWQIPYDAKGLERFVRNFADKLDDGLNKKAGYIRRKAPGLMITMGELLPPVTIEGHELDKHTGFMISWIYNGKLGSELIVTESREDKKRVVIDRFWNIQPMGYRRQYGFSPEELRTAAKIYEGLTKILEREFGKPISEHDNGTIYEKHLEEEPVVSSAR